MTNRTLRTRTPFPDQRQLSLLRLVEPHAFSAPHAQGSRCVTRDPQTSPATEGVPATQPPRPSPLPPLRAVRQDNGPRHVRDCLGEALAHALRRKPTP
jgi:hypothetical protein